MIALLCLASALIADDQGYSQKYVGRLAPQLRFESVLEGDRTTKSPSIQLKGTVTLLEFWFTTCGPCRKAVPHLNKLVRDFGPKGLQSFAVTFEPANLVQKYLKEVPIDAPIAIDTAQASINAYGVTAYPTTVLIGKDGKVLACTSPDAITDQVLADALAGKPVKVHPKDFSAVPAPELVVAAEPSIASVRINAREVPGNTSFSITPERAAIKGVGMRQLVQALLNLDPNQSEMHLLPDARIFEVEANLPGGTGGGARELLKAAVINTFHLEVTVESRDMSVAVFRRKGELKAVKPWDGKTRGATGNQFKGMPLASLTDSVAYSMGMVGIDETGDKNYYDFEYLIDDKKPIAEQLLSIYGIEVTKETRKLPFTSVKQTK